MTKLFLSCLFAFGVLQASSQKVYFIYLQSEQEQPFFVKMDEKIHSSSATGYLILSKLLDSTYNFSVGFPGQKWPEQRFGVTLGTKDHGFLLKNFGEKGWGLFNLQTLAVIMAAPTVSKESSFRTEKKEVSEFTNILARAADDPSLLEKTIEVVARKEESKGITSEPGLTTPVPREAPPDPNNPVIYPDAVVTDKVDTPGKATNATAVNEVAKAPVDSPVATTKTPVQNETQVVKDNTSKKANVVPPNTAPAVVVAQTGTEKQTVNPVVVAPATTGKDTQDAKDNTAIYRRSVVTRNAEYSNAEGVSIVFVDDAGNGSRDTISILIPQPRPMNLLVAEPAADTKKFLDINTEPAKETTGSPVAAKETVTAKPTEKANCKVIATDNDFLKLRKKMVAETDDDDMVDEARKYFKTTCFTTSQVRNLGVLFLDDLGKYKFYDMAYVFVSDRENFASLQSELKNEYYINRFKAMLK